MNQFTLRKIQNWVKKTWKKSPKKGITEKDELLFLFEEIGEIAQAARKINGYRDDKKSQKALRDELEKEFGDCIVSLSTLANRYGISLEKGFMRSKESIERRYIRRKS